jgi:hypothetical protein
MSPHMIVSALRFARSLGLVLAVSLSRLSAIAAPDEMFHPGAVWLDNNRVAINAHGGGMLVYGGTYYWFGEHKIAGRAGNDAHVGVHVYTSTNLYDWTDAGIALPVSKDPGNDLAEGCILERPKVIYCAATGKFVMWFHLEPKGKGYAAARSGIAVADHPTGPYQYLGSIRPDAGVWPMNVPAALQQPLAGDDTNGFQKVKFTGGSFPDFPTNEVFRRDFSDGQMARDMTLFVDDDGAAYQIYASEENSTLHISQLRSDYLASGGRYVRVFPGGFNEAPALFKHRGKYYLITSGCTGWNPNAARVAEADSIWGSWTPLGNPCLGRGAEVTFGGQSTYVLPVPGKKDAYIFMADRWQPNNAIDGRYVWLPIFFQNDHPFTMWESEWNVNSTFTH